MRSNPVFLHLYFDKFLSFYKAFEGTIGRKYIYRLLFVIQYNRS